MRIALLGLGSVGRGIVEVLAEKNLGIIIVAVADSKSGVIDPKGIDPAGLLERKRRTGMCGEKGITALDIAGNADYDVLVEVTPTDALKGEPATTHITTALSRKRHVVTSNKGPIALNSRKLRALAEANAVSIRYEATVAGAIPIMHTLENGLAGNSIHSLYGVLNGTCNYILTRMADEGLTYDQALAEAREMGYAEADPTYDVKGIDAAIKLVILANTLWDRDFTLEDVEICGIDLLTSDALKLASDQDCTIRLIAEAEWDEKGKNGPRGFLRVSPRIVRRDHPLVTEGTLNAITLEADLAGEITLIGKGAGSIETASAIIGDLLYIRDRYVRGH